MKKCNKCKELKEMGCFTADRTKKDGKRTICRDCRIKINKRQFSHPAMVGVIPEDDKVSIYYLQRLSNDEIFYVGQTVNPGARIGNHRLRFGKDFQLVVIRNVAEEQATYWECKTIVELIDAGHCLINSMSGANQRNKERRNV